VINNGYVTFGSFNNFKKINIGVVNVWSKILNSNQKNKIIIKSESFQNEEFKNYVSNLFFQNKVLAPQLILDWNVLPDRKDLLQDYNKIDIALDTFPYNGMTTSFEALSMNVPVLTKSGDSFFSKCGESININFDMMDWISKDNDDYINKAIKYSSNLDYLKSIKLKLKNNKNNKVFDIKSFSEDFANALIDINKTGQRIFDKQSG
jgi:predicted O-linked N-acetylglucosamine transferase (SPINDLY family)